MGKSCKRRDDAGMGKEPGAGGERRCEGCYGLNALVLAASEGASQLHCATSTSSENLVEEDTLENK